MPRKGFVGEMITTAQAIAVVFERRGHTITRATMINWCKKYKVGKQIEKGQPWFIDKVKLEKLLDKYKDVQG